MTTETRTAGTTAAFAGQRSRRHLTAALVVAFGTLGFAVPAAAGAAPDLDEGCTSEKGISTCTTTTFIATTLTGSGSGPVTDGSPVARACQAAAFYSEIWGPGTLLPATLPSDMVIKRYAYEGTPGATFTLNERVTTTFVRHGAPRSNGRILSETHDTTVESADLTLGFYIGCFPEDTP